MQSDIIRMLRYNTGTDKKAFVAFKESFDAVIFNATIVAYSGSAIADLVSVHKNQYIIDPQTHIMQHDIMAIMSKDKKTGQYHIKQSVKKYLDQLPGSVMEIIEKKNRPLSTTEINSIIDDLVKSVFEFETQYVNSFIKKKEYDKYLRYVNVGPEPKVIIAPYFMLKRDMAENQIHEYIELNRKCLEKFSLYQEKRELHYPVAAQLVIDREILKNKNLCGLLKEYYDYEGYEYIFLWISDFSSFECSLEEKKKYYDLLEALNQMGKKPLMAYGGYDSILLTQVQMPVRLFGVAQSVGYGEARSITPVGGGLPVNKYYFYPLHRRMRFDEALGILMENGYFSSEKSNAEHANDYYAEICNCEQCKKIIKNDIDNFRVYNESIPYTVNARYGEIKRNRPTTEATLVAAFHFLFCKNNEWEQVNKIERQELIRQLLNNYKRYGSKETQKQIEEWCGIFAK